MKLSKEFKLTFLFLFFLLICFSRSVNAKDDSIDWSCVDLRFSGICICTSGRIGLGITVTFWLPEIYIETVKKPGDGQFSSKSAAVAQSNVPIYIQELLPLLYVDLISSLMRYMSCLIKSYQRRS